MNEKEIIGVSAMAKEHGYKVIYETDSNAVYTSEDGYLNFVLRSKVNPSIWFYTYLGDGFDYSINWVYLCKKGPKELLFCEEMVGNPIYDEYNAFASLEDVDESSEYSELKLEIIKLIKEMEIDANKARTLIQESEGYVTHADYIDTANEIVLNYVHQLDEENDYHK